MNTEHWQNQHISKDNSQVSWTQEYPQIAIDYLNFIELDKSASIIDVGGGSGNLVDTLLALGYLNITVLDISPAALAKSRERLGAKAKNITWIAEDIIKFQPSATYDFWYDRAVFHFITNPDQIQKYIELVRQSLNPKGHFLLGTFSKNGPSKCSGLEVCRYSEINMRETFSKFFIPQKCFTELHTTPFGTTQEFQFCGFKK